MNPYITPEHVARGFEHTATHIAEGIGRTPLFARKFTSQLMYQMGGEVRAILGPAWAALVAERDGFFAQIVETDKVIDLLATERDAFANEHIRDCFNALGLATQRDEARAELERWKAVHADIIAAHAIDPTPFLEKHGLAVCADCGRPTDPEVDAEHLCTGCWEIRQTEYTAAPAPSLSRYACCDHCNNSEGTDANDESAHDYGEYAHGVPCQICEFQAVQNLASTL